MYHDQHIAFMYKDTYLLVQKRQNFKSQLEKFLNNDIHDRRCIVCLEEKDGNICDICGTFVCDQCCMRLKVKIDDGIHFLEVTHCPVCKDRPIFAEVIKVMDTSSDEQIRV